MTSNGKVEQKRLVPANRPGFPRKILRSRLGTSVSDGVHGAPSVCPVSNIGPADISITERRTRTDPRDDVSDRCKGSSHAGWQRLAVVLLPLTAFAWNHPRGNHHAILTQLGEGAVNTVAAGTGFVAKLHWSAARLPNTLNQFLQRRGGVGNARTVWPSQRRPRQ